MISKRGPMLGFCFELVAGLRSALAPHIVGAGRSQAPRRSGASVRTDSTADSHSSSPQNLENT
jgi:hypothetical protein